jgi:hypothetical protein
VACSGFDGQVVRYDPQLEDLMARFVCVRLVQANALDLSLFQFDYDLTFAAFFLNADRTVYGRFGSRSHHEAERDISLAGLRKALAAALELHQGYPANRAELKGKQPQPVQFKTPEDYPSLAGKYAPTLNYGPNVAASCVHCHQTREAERLTFRAANKPMPDEVIFPWPIPTVVGLAFDPAEKATVREVTPGSAAAKAGFRPGDEMGSLEGQPLLSIADVQWVLHHAPSPATLHATVQRAGQWQELTLALEPGWRRRTDISWRATSWDLRRMTTGGLVLKALEDDARRQAALPDSALTLRVDYVGEYGEHAVGKKAGFRKDDLIVEIDGQSQRMTESELFGYLLQKRMPGVRIPATVLRAGDRVRLELPMQ